jgi:hypothetical protein
MAADPGLIARIDSLVTLFNRKSMDLPDGLFDRRTQFLLNGTPFEAMLGRSSSDPLVLMIARGPAGFRFAMKAVQHAVPDARVERGDVGTEHDSSGDGTTVPVWLSGHLRGTNAPVEVVIAVTLRTDASGVVTQAEVSMDPGTLDQLREARLRE